MYQKNNNREQVPKYKKNNEEKTLKCSTTKKNQRVPKSNQNVPKWTKLNQKDTVKNEFRVLSICVNAFLFRWYKLH